MENVLHRLDRLESEVGALKRLVRDVLEMLMKAFDVMLEAVREDG